MAKYKKRKDGRYASQVVVGHKPDGRPIRTTIYAATISELEKKKSKVVVDLENYVFIKDKTVTWNIFSERWLSAKKVSLSNNSIATYTRVIEKFLSPLSGMKMVDIRTEDLQKIIMQYKSTPTTAYKIRLTLRQIFREAVNESVICKDPTTGLVIPKYKSPEKRVLSKEELLKISSAQLTKREEMYIRLIRNYGLRKEEALALTKSDFKFDTEQIVINKAAEFLHNQPAEKATKNGRSRKLYMMHNDIQFFKQYLAELDDSDKHVFRVLNGKRWITNISFRHMFDSIKKKCGFDENSDISSHMFRHTFVTDCYYAGIKVKDAQYLAGHMTASVTMDIYTHLDKQNTSSRDLLEAYRSK